MAVSAMEGKTKICTGPCGLEKSWDDFHVCGTDRRHPWCKDCKNKQQRDHYASNLEGHRHRSKARGIKFRYGLDPDDYLALMKTAECNICGSTTPGRGQEFMCVDHDHKTGKIRGTLCIACNLAIGYLKDDPSLAIKAASYLTTNKKGGD